MSEEGNPTMITSSFDPWATIPDWCDEHEEMDVGVT
jgi:hypothetical protein